MSDTGKLIQQFRQKAGFSQKTLARALHITDKAISKWERGICLPDVSLLPKLSLLLDVDVELLISKSIEQGKWVGLIDIDGCDLSQIVYDKPLVYYLLTHYLLLGIQDIHILTNDKNKEYLSDDKFCSLGFRFIFAPPESTNLMVMNHPWFLFGSDLTQQFQGAMLSGRNMKLVPENQEAMVFIAHDDAYFRDRDEFMKNASTRTLGRGMVCLDMGDADSASQVAGFVETYQKNAGLLIGSLEEIAYRRGILSGEQLDALAGQTPYARYLRALRGKPQVG